MPPALFPVPVLSGSLVSCPGCWCAVMRPDLARHAAVCPGRPVMDLAAGARESETMAR